MPLAAPPSEACRPPAPKGMFSCELEKKKRADTRSRELRKSSIPVGGELIVGELAGFADGELHQRTGRSACGNVRKRKQISIRRRAELIALKSQQRRRHGIDASHSKIGGQIGFGLRRGASISCRHIRNERADQRSRRIAAALARALIVDEEESQLAPGTDRTAQAAAENVLLNYAAAASRFDSGSIRWHRAPCCGKTRRHRRGTGWSRSSGSALMLPPPLRPWLAS